MLPDLNLLPAEALKALVLAQHETTPSAARKRDRASETADRQAATDAVRAQVGEAGAADRAVGATTGRTGKRSQRRRASSSSARRGICTSCSWPQAGASAVARSSAASERRRHVPKKSACPDCGGELRKLGEDVSEMLEYVPASFQVIRHVRPKLGCTQCDEIVQAAAPSRPIERGLAGPGLLAHVLVSKYAIISRCIASRRFMRARALSWSAPRWRTGWVEPASCWSRWSKRCVARDGGPASCMPMTCRCRCWRPAMARPRRGGCGRMFAMTVPRGHDGRRRCGSPTRPIARASIPSGICASFAGTLQADAYAGFNQAYETGRIQEAACWAHVRRKFYDLAQSRTLRRWRRKRWSESQLSTLSSERSAAGRRKSGNRFGKRRVPSPCSNRCDSGSKTACPSSRGSRIRRRRFAMRSHAGMR